MQDELRAALASGSHVTLDKVAEAFDRAVEAAYRNHPRDGYAAAVEVLRAPEVEAPVAEAPAPASAQPSEPIIEPPAGESTT